MKEKIMRIFCMCIGYSYETFLERKKIIIVLGALVTTFYNTFLAAIFIMMYGIA